MAGGTIEPGEWSTVPDPDVAKEIYEKCVDLEPALKGSEVVGGWACLRPGRETVRLEIENRGEGSPTVIHNYGQLVSIHKRLPYRLAGTTVESLYCGHLGDLSSIGLISGANLY